MIKNLVFEGGGVKGAAFLGAIEELEKRNVLAGIKRVAGTSAGAITAVLLAVGYSVKEISGIVKKMNFANFADDDFGVLRDAGRLLKKYGWHKGEFFRSWIGQCIAGKCGLADITFAGLKSAGGMELYLTGTNLTKQRVDIFSHEASPNMQIRDAARISMSIPLYFQAVELDGDIMVDGGVSYNYPIDIFDDGKKNRETLGLRLDSSTELEFAKQWTAPSIKIADFDDYILALLAFYNAVANNKHLKKSDVYRTVFIDTMDIKATDFNLTDEQIENLVENGRKGVEAYFNPVK